MPYWAVATCSKFLLQWLKLIVPNVITICGDYCTWDFILKDLTDNDFKYSVLLAFIPDSMHYWWWILLNNYYSWSFAFSELCCAHLTTRIIVKKCKRLEFSICGKWCRLWWYIKDGFKKWISYTFLSYIFLFRIWLELYL